MGAPVVAQHTGVQQAFECRRANRPCRGVRAVEQQLVLGAGQHGAGAAQQVVAQVLQVGAQELRRLNGPAEASALNASAPTPASSAITNRRILVMLELLCLRITNTCLSRREWRDK